MYGIEGMMFLVSGLSGKRLSNCTLKYICTVIIYILECFSTKANIWKNYSRTLYLSIDCILSQAITMSIAYLRCGVSNSKAGTSCTVSSIAYPE
jgi:hypothetical protein